MAALFSFSIIKVKKLMSNRLEVITAIKIKQY